MTFEKRMIPWNKGKKMSLESRQKLSESTKGRIPWNKDTSKPEVKEYILKLKKQWENKDKKQKMIDKLKRNVDVAQKRAAGYKSISVQSGKKFISKPQLELFNKIKLIKPDAKLEYFVKEISRFADIAFIDKKIDVEYDGHYWHDNRKELDLMRDLQFNSIGWTVIRVNDESIELFLNKLVNAKA